MKRSPIQRRTPLRPKRKEPGGEREPRPMASEKTGWPAPELAQDDDRKLFGWFASRLDARQRVREAVGQIKPASRRGSYSGGVSGEAVGKEAPVRSEAYRRLVAAMPCWLCGVAGRSQAAHADEGKGLAIKSDDRTCYPLCGPTLTSRGCHYEVGTAGRFTRENRRAIEAQAGAETRAAITAAGLWPANLPKWTEES